MGNESDWQNLNEELDGPQTGAAPNGPETDKSDQEPSSSGQRMDSVTIDLDLDDSPDESGLEQTMGGGTPAAEVSDAELLRSSPETAPESGRDAKQQEPSVVDVEGKASGAARSDGDTVPQSEASNGGKRGGFGDATGLEPSEPVGTSEPMGVQTSVSKPISTANGEGHDVSNTQGDETFENTGRESEGNAEDDASVQRGERDAEGREGNAEDDVSVQRGERDAEGRGGNAEDDVSVQRGERDAEGREGNADDDVSVQRDGGPLPTPPDVKEDDVLDDAETLELDIEAVEAVSKPTGSPPPHKPPLPPPPGGGPSVEGPAHVRRDVIGEFRSLIEQGRRWERRLVEGELETVSDKKRKAAYYYELGEIEERFFGSESKAAKAYRDAVRLHAGLLVNLWAVRRILSRHGKWQNVIKLINAELKLAEDPVHRRELWLEKAALLEGMLEDPEGAAKSYRTLLDEDPTNLEALMGLEAIAAASGDSEALVELARRQIDATASVGRKVALLVELERKLRRSGADYEACRRVLEEAMDLVGPEREFFREWELLATVHERHDDLFHVFERHIEWSLSAGEWVEAVGVARRMARLAIGPLGDPQRAARGMNLLASHPEASAAVARDRLLLSWMSSDWEAILELTKDLLDEGDLSRTERVDVEMSRVVALALAGRPDEAYDFFSSVVGDDAVGQDPETAVFRVVFAARQGTARDLFDALDALGKIFERHETEKGDFEAIVAGLTTARAYLRFAIAMAEGGVDEEALTEVGALCKKALMVEPRDSLAFRLYEEVLLGLGDLATLADLLEAGSEDAYGSELAWVLEGLAWICYGPLGDHERGARALKRLVAESEDSLMAAFRLAVLSEKYDDPSQAAAFWRKVAERTVDSHLRVDALLRSADLLWVHNGDATQALECLEEVLETSPGDQTAIFQVERILTHEGRWEELAALLRREAASAPSPEFEERLLLKAADILDMRLDKAAEAEDIYRELVLRFPQRHSAAWLLAHVWRKSGHWEELVDYWVERSKVDGETFGLEEAARICEYELGQLDRAQPYYMESFEEQPWDVFLVERLVTLAYVTSNPGQAVDVLDRFFDARQSRDDETNQTLTAPVVDTLRAEIAMLMEIALDDAASGWERWADLVDEEGILGKMARWAGLRWAVRSSDWAGRSVYGDRLAESLHGLLHEVVSLRAAVHSAVAEPGSTSSLPATEEGGEVAVSAASLLQPVGTWSERLFEERVSIAPTDLDRGWALLTMALASWRRGRWAESYEAACRAAEVMGDEPATLSLAAELALRSGHKEAHATWLARLGQAWADDEMSADSFVSAALAFESVGRTDDALWCWRQALNRSSRRRAFEGLADLLGRLKRWIELSEVLSLWLDQEVDGSLLADLYFRRGTVREEHLGDVVGAAMDYHRVLARDSGHMVAAYRLAVLYARDGNGQRAVELLERVRRDGEDEDLVWKARIALAEVTERVVGDAEAARPLYRDLVELGDRPDSWERWLGFCVRTKRWEDAEEAFSRLDELVSDDSERARLAIRQGLFYRDFVVNREKAARALERARSIRPADMEPVRILVSLFNEMGDKEAVELVIASALQEQKRLLGAQPFDVSLYENVLELADMKEDRDRRFFAAGALDLLGRLPDEEVSWYREECEHRFPFAKDLGESAWSTLLCRPEVRESGATEICRAIGHAVARIEGRHPSDLGLGRSDRISIKKATGVVAEILDIAARFGVVVDTVYSWNRSGLTWLDGESGAILVVGEDWRNRSLDSEDLFELGRNLAAARLRASTMSGLSADKVQLYLVAATASVVSDYRHDLPPDKVADMAKALNKAMSRKDRKGLALAATTYARRSSQAEAWLKGVSLTRDRAGLLLSGDLAVAAKGICRREGVGWSGPEDGDSVLRSCTDVGELLVYSVSETFVELRKELGMTWKL